MVIKPEDYEYYELFHEIVQTGIISGLAHPYHKIHMFKEDFENILERAYLYEKGKENE